MPDLKPRDVRRRGHDPARPIQTGIGAATFDGADGYETGRARRRRKRGHRRGGRAVLFATLPLVEMAATRPLAARILHEMIVWLPAGQERPRI